MELVTLFANGHVEKIPTRIDLLRNSTRLFPIKVVICLISINIFLVAVYNSINVKKDLKRLIIKHENTFPDDQPEC